MEAYYLLTALNLAFLGLGRKFLKWRGFLVAVVPVASAVAFEAIVRFVERTVDALWFVSFAMTTLFGVGVCGATLLFEIFYRRCRS